jgi:5'-3' exonuclease
MYENEQTYTLNDVLELRKKLLYPRSDITYEVLAAARRYQPKLFIVCAPFETDHQMKALQEQNLLDVAVSTDSDLIALGIKRTISSSVTDGQVQVRDYKKLTTEVLPKLFGVQHEIVYQDLAFLCNMLGNDNLPGGLFGSGKADVIKRMKEYLALEECAKKNYILKYCMLCGG